MQLARKAHKKGRLEVICGAMFSGKTEELMRRLKRAEWSRKSVVTIKHEIDQRQHQGYTYIMSHDGKQRLATSLGDKLEQLEEMFVLANDADVIGIDEIQFFPQTIIPIIHELIDAGKQVIVAGLDLDFRGMPFGIVPLLLAFADEVLKLKAVCVVCFNEAHHTQRIVNGKPANHDDPTILVGASECYEARCRDCFSIDRSVSYIYENLERQMTLV